MGELSKQIAKQIKADLALKDITFADIAKELKCSRQQVWQIANGIGKSTRIRRAISEAIGKDYWFGDRD
jgi:transcriptional regulator with XRE-family HTH domain